MKPKAMVKMALDLFMSMAMLLLMAYSLLSESLHEWLGMAIFAAFVAHHLLNAAWHKNLTKGRHTSLRWATLAVDALVFLCMVALMVSGVILSEYIFVGLPIQGLTAFARTAHLLASYWGFVLMAVHLGMHWHMICGMVGRLRGKKTARPSLPGQVVGALLAACGVYAFVKNNIADYLFLRTQFVFIDFSQPLWMFMVEYLAIAALFVWVTQGLMRWMKKYVT